VKQVGFKPGVKEKGVMYAQTDESEKDPCRQQQHTALALRVTSNRATVTVFVTM